MTSKAAVLAAVLGIMAIFTVIGYSQYPMVTIEDITDMKIARIKSDVDWDKRFSFVPNNVQNCTDLFRGKAKKLSLPLKKKLDGYMKDYTTIMKGMLYKEGYTAQVQVAYTAYVQIASHPSVKTICETGFNAGHSTFGWLSNNPVAQVYSFDLGYHVYAKPMANHIKKLYPGRFHVTWGDSTKTLPEFRRKNPNATCDLMIIDGGHTTDICKSDFMNFWKMASADSVVIMDNYPQNGWGFMMKLGNCWEWAKRHAYVAEIFNCYVPGKAKAKADFGFSVGRMTNK